MTTDHAERKLAAIFAADVERYSRLMGYRRRHTGKRQRSHAVNSIDARDYAARCSCWLTARVAFQFHGRSSASRLIGWPLTMRSITSAM
jgi:hypothetical protein